MKTTLKSLLDQANTLVNSCTASEAKTHLDDNNFVFIDVREKQEVEAEGMVANAINITRGMLEFAIDPLSPYYNSIFESNKHFIFYCKSGGRSALAAKSAKEMGVENVINMAGGYNSFSSL